MTRKWKSPLQLCIGRPRCPCCGKRFTDILRHLNHKRSKCAGWFNNGSSLESPPPSSLPQHPSDDHGSEDLMADDSEFVQDFPGSTVDRGSTASSNSCSRQRVEFPGAGVTHGRTASFIDRFNEDRHSGSRVENAHYPFAGKDEWELASFLHSSGLSMQKIDDFLRLKMVITYIAFCSATLIILSRSRMLMYPFQRRRRSVVGWRCSPVSLIGNQRRSPSWAIQQANPCTSSTVTLWSASSMYSGIPCLPTTWTSPRFASIKMQNTPFVYTVNG